MLEKIVTMNFTLIADERGTSGNRYSYSTFNLQPSRLDGNLESPPAVHLV